MAGKSDRRVRITRPDEGRTVGVVGDTYRFLGVGGDTDRAYTIMEATVPAGSGPPLHFHNREEEGFYVLDGELEFTADGETVHATAGTFLNLPKGSRHRFQNVGDRPARILILCAPAGIEGFFEEADGKRPDGVVEAAARYGIEILPSG